MFVRTSDVDFFLLSFKSNHAPLFANIPYIDYKFPKPSLAARFSYILYTISYLPYLVAFVDVVNSELLVFVSGVRAVVAVPVFQFENASNGCSSSLGSFPQVSHP